MSDPIAALDAIGQLPDSEIDIAEAALQLARIDLSDADERAARQHLSEIAQQAVAAGREIGPHDIAGQADVLAQLIGGQFGYHGDPARYEEPDNANLLRVIERRRGLPVALGVIWLHAIAANGWQGHGVNFPGHFLIALSDDQPKGGARQVVIDVFAGGQPLSVPELRTLVKSVEGEKAELRAALLRPMSNRAVLLRLQNNITSRRLAARDVPGALACTENMLRFAPEEANLWREAGNLNQTLDHLAAAMRCYERCLALIPEGEYATQTRSKIAELRSRLN